MGGQGTITGGPGGEFAPPPGAVPAAAPIPPRLYVYALDAKGPQP